MQQSTLQVILGVERELREQLDAERGKADQWLEGERRRIAAEHEAALAHLKESAGPRVEAAKQAARVRAEAIVQRADETVRVVESLRDDALRARVARAIACIVPGTTHAG